MSDNGQQNIQVAEEKLSTQTFQPYNQPIYFDTQDFNQTTHCMAQPNFNSETSSTTTNQPPSKFQTKRTRDENDKKVVICFFLGFFLIIPFMVAYVIGIKSKSKGIKLLASCSFLLFSIYFFGILAGITCILVFIK